MIRGPPSAAASSETPLACLEALPTGSKALPAGSEALPSGSEVLSAGSKAENKNENGENSPVLKVTVPYGAAAPLLQN